MLGGTFDDTPRPVKNSIKFLLLWVATTVLEVAHLFTIKTCMKIEKITALR
jgi:hypothetical protein